MGEPIDGMGKLVRRMVVLLGMDVCLAALQCRLHAGYPNVVQIKGRCSTFRRETRVGLLYVRTLLLVSRGMLN